MSESKTKVSDIWVRKEQFNGRIDEAAVHEYARTQKASGDLIFKYHDGGIRTAILVKTIEAEVEMTERQRKEFGL